MTVIVSAFGFITLTNCWFICTSASERLWSRVDWFDFSLRGVPLPVLAFPGSITLTFTSSSRVVDCRARYPLSSKENRCSWIGVEIDALLSTRVTFSSKCNSVFLSPDCSNSAADCCCYSRFHFPIYCFQSEPRYELFDLTDKGGIQYYRLLRWLLLIARHFSSWSPVVVSIHKK